MEGKENCTCTNNIKFVSWLFFKIQNTHYLHRIFIVLGFIRNLEIAKIIDDVHRLHVNAMLFYMSIMYSRIPEMNLIWIVKEWLYFQDDLVCVYLPIPVKTVNNKKRKKMDMDKSYCN